MPIVVPAKFNRNHARVAEVGYENTGEASLAYARELLGLESYADTDILDVGCGFRLAITFINRNIPVKSYTGVEVFKPLTDYLGEEFRSDERFSFSHWDTENSLFNRDGRPMYMFDRFPVERPDFDVIWAWSVFTHLHPYDSGQMLRIARRHRRPNTQLFFSAFIDDNVEKFEDRPPGNLVHAYYSRAFMTELIEQAGWRVRLFRPARPDAWVQSVFVCDPV